MIECKYVFELVEGAAVCGFEAFINDKHIIGQVEEKKAAHKKYKTTIASGKGAYLSLLSFICYNLKNVKVFTR